MKNEYDIIVCGGGMSGLSLIYRALKANIWSNKSIILIDKEIKTANDKTWCFWENTISPFEDVIFKKWKEMCFFDIEDNGYLLNTKDYSYNMIRSSDFYNYTFDYIKSHSNLKIVREEIKSISNTASGCEVLTDSCNYHAEFVFNSVYQKPKLKENNTYLQQHFKGVIIESDNLNLDPNKIHLMDFRTSQEYGATFFYVLPTSDNTALVEYTLFSEKLLDPHIYHQRLKEYIVNILGIAEYKIIESEFGVIPMTDYPFERTTGSIINIGTIGGDTRGSTGYTFSNTQKTISNIIQNYKSKETPLGIEEHISRKHRIYDSTMLKVLAGGKYKGHQLFTDMFTKSKAYDILAFLDAESSLLQDFGIIKSLIPQYFFKPFFQSLLQSKK